MLDVQKIKKIVPQMLAVMATASIRYCHIIWNSF